MRHNLLAANRYKLDVTSGLICQVICFYIFSNILNRLKQRERQLRVSQTRALKEMLLTLS